MIRTKIVATLGPASSSIETLLRLFEEGADVCRLNFSHGDPAQHLATLGNVRAAAEKSSRHVAVLGDLCGPKIRLGKVHEDTPGGGMVVNTGDLLHIQRDPIVGRNLRVSTTYPNIVDDVATGHRVLVEDGLMRFLCIEKSADELVCSCTSGGILRSGKGINLPNSPVSIPSITERDWDYVRFAMENELEYLALSFVRSADDLLLLRQHLENHRSDIKLIAKIEKSEALKNIDAIIDAADGLMIARGDLGVEMDMAQVPLIQKDLVRRCQRAGKPVIVATQMLQSMIEQSSPTRAEVSDVANAIFDAADAVMLSGETSVGKYPLAAVHMMSHIAEVTEQYLDQQADAPPPAIRADSAPMSSAVARGVRQMVHDLNVKLVAVSSQTGATARIFSKHRFPVPIVAFSSNQRTLRQMALHYGVAPQALDVPGDVPGLVAAVDALLRQNGLAAPSERIIIVAGATMGAEATLNGVIIHTIGTGAAG